MGSELRLKIAAAVMFMATLVAGPAFAADIESARIWRAPDNTRLVLDISDAFDYSVFPLDNPSRLVVDIKGAQLKASLDSLDISPTPISKIRSAVRDGLLTVFVLAVTKNRLSYSKPC